MMRRIVTLVVVALVMAAMMLSVTAPAMAEPRNFCSASPETRVAPNVVTPGSDPRLTVLFDCVTRGEPGQPPLVRASPGHS
jgi:hypothetical protein